MGRGQVFRLRLHTACRCWKERAAFRYGTYSQEHESPHHFSHRISSYVFSFLSLVELISRRVAVPTNTAYFPFAFRHSPFLNHYRDLFRDARILVSLYRYSARTLQSLALERALLTIRCVESRLASKDLHIATHHSVLSAVLGMVLYNLTAGEFRQAMIHVRGLWTIVQTRGGMETLNEDGELLSMILW